MRRRPLPSIAIAYALLLGCTVLLVNHCLVHHHNSKLRDFEGAGSEDTSIEARDPTSENELTSSNSTASIAKTVEALLDISLPITLDKRSLEPRKAATGFSCGESHVVKLKGYADLLRARNLSRVLPERDVFSSSSWDDSRTKLYDTCAVVGNSGTLLESEMGAEIDGHDTVIRFNGGVTEGYEQFVGTKTTFRILNRPDSAPLEPDEATISTIRDHQIRSWVRSLIDNPKRIGTAYIFDPEFLCYCWNWVGNKGHKPSSGLVGLIMALKTCESVTLYGFDSSNYFSDTSRPHYFDWERPAKGRERVHPFQHEQKLYQHLEQLGLISMRM